MIYQLPCVRSETPVLAVLRSVQVENGIEGPSSFPSVFLYPQLSFPALSSPDTAQSSDCGLGRGRAT